MQIHKQIRKSALKLNPQAALTATDNNLAGFGFIPDNFYFVKPFAGLSMNQRSHIIPCKLLHPTNLSPRYLLWRSLISEEIELQ